MPEKSPRQPRKPFQSAGRRVNKPVRAEGGERQPKKVIRKTKPYGEKPGGASEPSTDRPSMRKPTVKKSYSTDSDRERPAGSARRKPAVKKSYAADPDRERPSGKSPRKPGTFRKADEGGDYRKSSPVKRGRPRRNPEEVTERPVRKTYSKTGSSAGRRKFPTKQGKRFKAGYTDDGVRLNKYVANAGICSRREADQLIQAGVIKVNGEVVTALGTKVKPGDKVQYGDQALSNETKRYLLLNKQKGYVTTTKDPHAKNTVMELIEGACKERIYPVGRLDRNTTGLLLFTNDGEMAKKLMHPSSRIKKLYHVVLDQALKRGDMLKIAEGVELDDGPVRVDSIEYVEDAKDRREVGLEIHSGQNRVVRRIFEALGYKVTRLDRVMFAGLTKKNLPRGKWRFLNDREVISLKMLR
jgi:23S rRNA pseudouridine2605 synthase